MLSSLAPARRRVVVTVLGLLVVAIVAAVVAVIVHSAGGSTPAAAPVAQQRPGPVILVPGYGGSTRSLDGLATTLRRQGKTVQVLSLPGGGTGDLSAQARALGTVAAKLHAAGAQSVDVVGYSAGGVVARLWVRDDGGAALARRIVTLGSPHHGTDLAGLAGSLLPSACPTACQQLEPGSDLLTALNRGDETPAGPAFVSIWTTHDNVVLPPTSARLAGALDLTVQSVCASDTVDHTGLPDDRTVQAMVSAALAATPATAPAAGCR
jgi:triacylglycerol lipase